MSTFSILVVFAMAFVLRAETKVLFNQLPQAVQSAALKQSTAAQIVGASKETEGGQLIFEVETRVQGKSRDLSFDHTGKLLEVEAEVSPEAVPPAVLAVFRKRSQGGAIGKIESVTHGSAVSYEAVVTTAAGKHAEVDVNADGTPHKDR